MAEELDYRDEADAQRAFAAAFEGDEHVVVPRVVASAPKAMVSEWIEGTPLSQIIRSGEPEERDRVGLLLSTFHFSAPARVGLLHADPHPGNFQVLPDGRLCVIDFGAVARLPDGLPRELGEMLSLSVEDRSDELLDLLRKLHFVLPDTDMSAERAMAYLGPLVDPLRAEKFHFTREWIRGQAERLGDLRRPEFETGRGLNLPPQYLLIHRVTLGVGGGALPARRGDPDAVDLPRLAARLRHLSAAIPSERNLGRLTSRQVDRGSGRPGVTRRRPPAGPAAISASRARSALLGRPRGRLRAMTAPRSRISPPHTPANSRRSRAPARHARRTGQAAHRIFACSRSAGLSENHRSSVSTRQGRQTDPGISGADGTGNMLGPPTAGVRGSPGNRGDRSPLRDDEGREPGGSAACDRGCVSHTRRWDADAEGRDRCAGWRLRGDMPAGRPPTTPLDTATYPAEPRACRRGRERARAAEPRERDDLPGGLPAARSEAGAMPDARNTSVTGPGRRVCP